MPTLAVARTALWITLSGGPRDAARNAAGAPSGDGHAGAMRRARRSSAETIALLRRMPAGAIWLEPGLRIPRPRPPHRRGPCMHAPFLPAPQRIHVRVPYRSVLAHARRPPKSICRSFAGDLHVCGLYFINILRTIPLVRVSRTEVLSASPFEISFLGHFRE